MYFHRVFPKAFKDFRSNLSHSAHPSYTLTNFRILLFSEIQYFTTSIGRGGGGGGGGVVSEERVCGRLSAASADGRCEGEFALICFLLFLCI